jgi:hypothetical protein
MNVEAFTEKIEEFSSLYKKWWFEPLAKFKEEYLGQNPDVAELAKKNKYFYSAKYSKALEEFQSRLRSQNDLMSEIYDFIEQNCLVYLNATPKECEKIRNTVTNCYYVDEYGKANRFFEDLFFQYARERAIPQLEQTGDKIWFIRGLIAISIENSGIDYRDSILVLSDLRKAAIKNKIDPEPEFTRIAQISSNETPRGGSTPMRQLMEKNS